MADEIAGTLVEPMGHGYGIFLLKQRAGQSGTLPQKVVHLQ